MAWRDSFQIKLPAGMERESVDLGLIQNEDDDLLKLERAQVSMRRTTAGGSAPSSDPFASTAYSAQEPSGGGGAARSLTAARGKSLLRQSLELVQTDDHEEVSASLRAGGKRLSSKPSADLSPSQSASRRESGAAPGDASDEADVSPSATKRRTVVQRVKSGVGGLLKGKSAKNVTGELPPQLAAELRFDNSGVSADNPLFGQE